MNAKSLQNLKPWVKGQSGYPQGRRPQLPPELVSIKSLTSQEVAKIISKIARYTPAELQKHLEDKGASVLEINICLIFQFNLKSKTADFTKLSFLLDRCIGKVKDIVDDEESRDSIEELKKISMHELLSIVKDNLPNTPNS